MRRGVRSRFPPRSIIGTLFESAAAHGKTKWRLIDAREQRSAVTDQVDAAANAIGASVPSLDKQGQDSDADYLRTAAEGTHQASRWPQKRSSGEIWGHAEDYARRQPAFAFAGAMTAGFPLTRFLHRRHHGCVARGAERPDTDAEVKRGGRMLKEKLS